MFSMPPAWSRTLRQNLAVCFGLALAKELSGEFVTTDRYEFDPLVPLGIAPINSIR